MATKKKNPNNILFLEALIMALFIFGLGLIIGVLIEDARMADINNKYVGSRTNLLDIQTLSELLKDEDFSCEYKIKKNIEFGNKIYDDALTLADYEKSQILGNKLKEQHRIYDLLRTIFWINSIELKEECPYFHTLVYTYNYGEDDTIEKQKQEVFSRFAGELIRNNTNSIILIPIAINLDIESLNILKEKYGLEGTRLVFDEKIHATQVEMLEDFKEKILENL